MAKVKTLIVDLGAVLYAIDVARGIQSLKEMIPMARRRTLAAEQELVQLPLFVDFERGNLSPAGFRDELRKIGVSGIDQEIDDAWNSLLLNPIPGRTNWLRELGRHFQLFLLSNTNAIHWNCLEPKAREMLSCFEHLFLSFEMGLSKPDPLIFEAVLKARQLDRNACVFLDDSPVNVRAAEAIGLPSVQIEGRGGRDFEDFSRELLASRF